MSSDSSRTIEWVLPCVDLDAMTAFFVDDIGLRIDTVSPADDPAEIALSGHGARIRLRRATTNRPMRLIVRSDDRPAGAPAEEHLAPDGTVIEIVSSSAEVVVPDGVPSLSIVRASESFGVGRAGMGYRDLLPGRWGGRFIASHIRIPDEGDVADYVHFHRIRFQMIYVAVGWVDVVYEDQGPPFRMHAGDCVLQPPEIRHRVLRSSAGLEVVEIGCPAVHDTVADHELELPTECERPGRAFGGQRFVFHRAAEADPADWVVPGFGCRDTGIAAATDGLADAQVVSARAAPARDAPADAVHLTHDGEFAFDVVLVGTADFTSDNTSDGDDGAERVARLGRGDAVSISGGTTWAWSGWSGDFEVLEVTLPAGSVRAAGG